jgi:hypothetical protein
MSFIFRFDIEIVSYHHLIFKTSLKYIYENGLTDHNLIIKSIFNVLSQVFFKFLFFQIENVIGDLKNLHYNTKSRDNNKYVC